MNTNSWLTLGALALNLVVMIVTVTNSAADIKSEVAVIKNDIFYLKRDYQELKQQRLPKAL